MGGVLGGFPFRSFFCIAWEELDIAEGVGVENRGSLTSVPFIVRECIGQLGGVVRNCW